MPKKYSPGEILRSRDGWLLGLSVVIASLAITPALASPMSEQQLPTGEMQVYDLRKRVDMSSLVSLGPPEALGGEVLTGTPQLFGRIDFEQGNMRAGLFMATRGLIRVTFPFTEQTGKTHRYKAGDSYFIRQGSVILWDVKGAYVLKSFFSVTEPVSP
jgi:uncharacterized protein